MLNHPHITNALVDARHEELRASVAATRAGVRHRRLRPHPGLIAAATALLRTPRSQPQARAVAEPCEDPC